MFLDASSLILFRVLMGKSIGERDQQILLELGLPVAADPWVAWLYVRRAPHDWVSNPYGSVDAGTVSNQHLINKQVPVITVFVGDLPECILQGLVVFLPLTVCLGMVGR